MTLTKQVGRVRPGLKWHYAQPFTMQGTPAPRALCFGGAGSYYPELQDLRPVTAINRDKELCGCCKWEDE